MSMQTHNDAGLTAQHERLLAKFDNPRLIDALTGIVAHLWLPGHKQKFSDLRGVKGVRPVAITLEAKDGGGLVLSGAVARPDRETRKMKYDIIMSYDLTQPMRPDGRGAVVCSKNQVIARTGLSLLGSLIRFGEKRISQPRVNPWSIRHPGLMVPFNPGDETFDDSKLEALCAHIRPELRQLQKSKRAQELCDRDSVPGSVLIPADIVPDAIVAQAIEENLVYEDFRAVLGIPHWNPAANIREQRNPAAGLLGQHGVDDLDRVDETKLTQLMAALRLNVLLGEKLSEYEIHDALANPAEPVRMSAKLGDDDAFTADDAETRRRSATRLVQALRQAAGNSRAAREATDEDLLAAAKQPNQPMTLSRLSKTQIFDGYTFELPAHYAGDFLSPVDWTPPRRRPAAKQVA